MCTQEGLPDFKELTGKQWDKIFTDIEKKYPNSTMVFIGGEPTLHKDFEEIIERATCHNLHKHLVTNGYFLEKHLDLLKKHQCGITISVDGLGETHDKIRNKKGAFKKIESAVNKITEINQNLLPGEKPLWFNINFVILPENYQTIYEFLDTMLTYSPNKIVLSHPRHVSAELNQKMKDVLSYIYYEPFVPKLMMREKTDFSADYVKKINTVLKDVKSKYDPALVAEHPDFTEKERLFYYDEKDLDKIRPEDRCFSPYKIPFILPDGTISGCLYNTLGNAMAQSVKTIWASEIAEKIREYLDKNNQFPVCKRCTCFYKADEL